MNKKLILTNSKTEVYDGLVVYFEQILKTENEIVTVFKEPIINFNFDEIEKIWEIESISSIYELFYQKVERPTDTLRLIPKSEKIKIIEDINIYSGLLKFTLKFI